MAASGSGTRQRMVAAAAGSIRRHGASATSIDRVLSLSGAPRGSVYHHFPGGRAQLVEEAVGFAGQHVSGLIVEAAGTGSPVVVVDRFVAMWRKQLVESGFRDGCPVLAVAVESDEDHPELTDAVAEAFGRWHDLLKALLVDAGLGAGRADQLATFVIAAVEGALVLSRAQRRTGPLDDVGAELRGLLTAAIEESAS